MPTMPGSIIFYVSGHGFGHARRAAEVVRALLQWNLALPLLVRTAAPASIFTRVGLSPDNISQTSIDSGAVEDDALTINPSRTIDRAADLIARRDEIVAAEVATLRNREVALVLADIPFLAGDVAAALAVPAIGIGNFTWDWIYEPLTAGDPRGPELIAAIRASYAKFDGLLRLPFPHPQTAIRNVVDVPLLTAQSSVAKREILGRVGINPADARPRVLVGMRGGVSGGTLTRAVGEAPHLLFLSLQEPDAEMPANFVAVAKGTDFSDVLSVCDVIISKFGYSTVAECIAAGARMLWIRRTGFREDGIFEREGAAWLTHRELPTTDYREGRWADGLEAVLAAPPPPRSMPPAGAEAIAKYILRRLS